MAGHTHSWSALMQIRASDSVPVDAAGRPQAELARYDEDKDVHYCSCGEKRETAPGETP